MADPQTELKNWLAAKLEPHGVASRLAKFMQAAPTAITRMKNIDATNPKERRQIKPHEIKQLAEFFNELPPGYEGMTQWLKPVRDTQYVQNPEDEPQPEFDVDGSPGAAAFVNGQVSFAGKLPGATPEMKSAPGMGQGQVHDAGDARIQSNGVVTGHPVVAEWVLPRDYVRHSLDAAPTGIIILPVVGHSMEPRLYGGDRVIVDVSQNSWVSEAIYAIDDGDTRFQIKTIRKVIGSFPARYRVVSEADKDEEVYLDANQFRIVGRVVGRISRV